MVKAFSIGMLTLTALVESILAEAAESAEARQVYIEVRRLKRQMGAITLGSPW